MSVHCHILAFRHSPGIRDRADANDLRDVQHIHIIYGCSHSPRGGLEGERLDNNGERHSGYRRDLYLSKRIATKW